MNARVICDGTEKNDSNLPFRNIYPCLVNFLQKKKNYIHMFYTQENP